MRRLLALYRTRREPVLFAAVGIFVMLMSYVELWLMEAVLGIPPWIAYFIQTVISLELNFLLNHYLTYRPRGTRFGKAIVLFHATRLGLMVPVNLVLYPVLRDAVYPWLVRATMPDEVWLLGYASIAAQTVCLGLTFVVNYISNDKIVYRKRTTETTEAGSDDPPAANPSPRHNEGTVYRGLPPLPLVSVIIPVRNSEGPIRRQVESLVTQDYWEKGGRIEIILVGSLHDTTWSAIGDYIDAGYVTVLEAKIEADGRDANPKRNIGMKVARGQVLALTDSDMEMPRDWVSLGVGMLMERGHFVVAGSMISLGTGFWSDYVDHNFLGSKTPRMDPPYLITQETIGQPGYKLPITANVFLRREVWERVGGLHEQFTETYDDYVWFRDMVAAGYAIWCDARLAGYHRHREGFADLPREYRSAGNGCMDYMALNPDDPFSRARARQLTVMLYASLAGGIVLYFLPLLTLALGVVVVAGVSVFSGIKTKRAAGLLYPAVTFILGMAFTYGVVHRFFRQSWRGVVPTRTIHYQHLHGPSYSEAHK